MDDASRVRLTGPLEPYAAGYAAELARLGYTPLSALMQLRLAAQLSRYLVSAGLPALTRFMPYLRQRPARQ
jgi:integrase/recombinase XerD